MAAPRIVAVIPALDEEDAIGSVVRAMPPLVAETIVADNGSRDRTAAAAREAGARVVVEPRRGYGSACLAGIAAAGDADVLLFLDGDGSDDPAQAGDVVAPILDGRADLVIGSRNLGRRERGAQPWHAILGTKVSVGLLNLLSGARATDLGPFRAIRADALRRLGMADRNYGWTVEMQVKAALGGLRVVEVPVDHRPRAGGRSKVSGTVRGTIGAGTKIVGTILRHAWRLPALVACALVLSAVVLGWALGPPPPSAIARHLALYGAAFAAYLVALLASRGLSRRALVCALAAAVAWRAILVPVPPLLSNDVNRYVWEGRVQVHGGNPYRWADRPDAPRWVELRDGVWDGLNHKDYTAVYPPLFVLATRAVVAVHDSITAMKAFLVLCEIAAWAALARPAAASPAAARASPRARVEPARPRRDRRQRPQRGVRHPVARAGAPRARGRPARCCPRSPPARASCRSSCPGSSPPRGRDGTGGGTCSPRVRSRSRSSCRS